jgi:hypothetical protein
MPIKIWNKIVSFDMTKSVKCKIGHGKNEKKGEFASPFHGLPGLKGGTPIMLGPS